MPLTRCLLTRVSNNGIVGDRFVYSQRQQNPDGRMPLMDHIRELRNRVVTMALSLVAGMTAGFIFSTKPGTSSSAAVLGYDPRALRLSGPGRCALVYAAWSAP